MSFFTEIVKSAMGASTSAGQAETQTQHLLNALLRILLAMGGVDGLVNKVLLFKTNKFITRYS
jgi:hypothetical protein